MNKHQATYHCAMCDKDTPVSDETVKDIMEAGNFLIRHQKYTTLCSCGRHSYCSSLKLKVDVSQNEWRACYGSSSV